ncbi:MAG: YHYH protein [Pseudomonadota bacterium]
MMRVLVLTVAIVAGFCVQEATSHENEVTITLRGDERCILSNGTPNHDIGQFPNSGNPHSFSEQQVEVCVDATPTRGAQADSNVQSSGISLTGIVFRPGTADFFDASSPRGFSRDSSSGWRLEGMGAADLLGMDKNNAHVDHRGLYHYHGVSDSLVQSVSGTQIGYAADGFEIHYVGDAAVPGWQLNSGTRETAPFGAYDGTYVEDWVFVAGSGNLDECNGAMLNGAYVYFATDSYPFFPRCFWGEVSADFRGRR